MTSNGGHAPGATRYHEQVLDTQFKLSLRSISELKCASSREELNSVGLISALDHDDRPSFVIDVSSSTIHEGSLDLVYFNAALASHPALLAKLSGESTSPVLLDVTQRHAAFRQWLWGHTNTLDLATRGGAYLFADFLWWSTKIDRYRYVSGVPAALLRQDGTAHDRWEANRNTDPREHEEPKVLPQFIPERLPETMLDVPLEELTLGSSPPASSYGPFDYTRHPPCANMSDHVTYFRGIDWASTPLGDMSSWSPQLRCIVNMILNDHHHAVLFWGDEATMIYNEPFIELIGIMHPCMGQSAKVAAKEFWPHFEPIVQRIKSTGRTFSNSDMPLFVDRHGFLEEVYFSFQFIPILDSNGHVAGYYQPLVETTSSKLLERRISSLVEIGSKTAKARDLDAYWELVIKTISTNDRDTPFALLYAAENLSTSGISTHLSPGSSTEIDEYALKGSIGVDGGHAIAPCMIDLKDDSNIFHRYLVQASKQKAPIVVHFSDLELPDDYLTGIDWKGFRDPCRSVVICPVQPTNSEQVQGFLILGLNPRRPFDEEYQQFIHVLLRILATSLASVVLFDEEMRQKENAIGQAARIQEQLVAQLQMKEKKFQRYADQSNVAIFVIDAQGTYTYRNQGWYDIFDQAINAKDVMGAWAQIMWPEDIPVCEGFFSKLAVDKAAISFELRTNMPWKPPAPPEPGSEPQEYYKWILCSAYPELDENNQVTEIVGNVTDISKQKWAEDVQKRRTDSALESKKHLEHFIDTTSHEMRNPLSAIMQCADGILTSYPGTDPIDSIPSPTTYTSLLDQTIDAAQTIAQCAQHMKRIVDDILTISKLDSGLLVITPIDAQPEMVTRHAVKMFEAEARAAEVDLVLDIDESYKKLNVDWVSLDPTRLLQILINLITNSLKFTRFESDPRRIKVQLSACEQEPRDDPDGVQFESKLVENERHLVEDWNQGPSLYLRFSVSDTGRGLSEDERRTLFARFSQASPRTHIHYGGSGLGLFISRRLTEMQGGAIGLASEFKKGSTFAFYIKVRRSGPESTRRLSIPNIFPEDMRHRATTRREIAELHARPDSPVSERSSPTSIRFPKLSNCNEQPTAHPSISRPPAVQRRQSLLHQGIPNAAIGLPPEPDLNALKTKKDAQDSLHVLVVEDNLVNQKVLAKQLRNFGCIVNVANHGGEALDFLRKTVHWRDSNSTSETEHRTTTAECTRSELPTKLSLILMDWEMPVMNGLTAVAKIRESERAGDLTGHIPIIGVTANVREQQIQTAMDVGMDDVVSKPFRVPELMSRMRRMIDGIGGEDKHRKRESLESVREDDK